MSEPSRWQLSIENARSTLKAAGLRCTAARIAVVQCLHADAAPMTPLDVATQLHDYGFDKSTIYRSLTELNDAKVIVRLDLGDSVRRFELSPDSSDATQHPHFMCTSCGEVVCLPDFTVELKSMRKRSRPPGVISEVLVRGQCTECLS